MPNQPAILLAMRILTLIAICCLVTGASTLSYAQPSPAPSVTQPDGQIVGWNDWLAKNGTTAAVFLGSWLPEDQRNLNLLKEIDGSSEVAGVNFVIVAVQEPIEKSRGILNNSGLSWLHDRHGALLKHLLIYQIPSLVVIDKDGSVLARLSLDPESLTLWKQAQ